MKPSSTWWAPLRDALMGAPFSTNLQTCLGRESVRVRKSPQYHWHLPIVLARFSDLMTTAKLAEEVRCWAPWDGLLTEFFTWPAPHTPDHIVVNRLIDDLKRLARTHPPKDHNMTQTNPFNEACDELSKTLAKAELRFQNLPSKASESVIITVNGRTSVLAFERIGKAWRLVHKDVERGVTPLVNAPLAVRMAAAPHLLDLALEVQRTAREAEKSVRAATAAVRVFLGEQ